MTTRRRSLLKDGNDINAFRHHRDRHVGHAISNEYYQHAPFFFTRECSQLNLVGQYKGASAFLILNGPSLVSGDYDLSQLKRPGVITYGVNNGPATFRPTFWSCVDDPQRFLKSIWLDPTITKFVPHAHAEKPIFDNDTWTEMNKDGQKVLVGECPNCIFFHRNEKFVANRWLFEDKINWGNSKQNGGSRTVMLPALRILFLLGFRKVYLLGADFTMSEDYAYHFDEKREKGAVNCNNSTYKTMKDVYFPQLKPYFKEEGFEVYNCNPDSGLKDVFDFCSFKDAISEATGKLGEVENERTWGMYCKPGEKDQTVHEPTVEEKKHLANLSRRNDVISAVRGYDFSTGTSQPERVQPERVQPERVQPERVQPERVQPERVQRQEQAKRPEPVQETSVRTTQIPPPKENNKGYRVVSVDNPVDDNELSVSSRGRIIDKKSDTNIKQVSVRPEVERIEEIPKSPIPTIGQVSGERKLIKHLPFRS